MRTNLMKIQSWIGSAVGIALIISGCLFNSEYYPFDKHTLPGKAHEEGLKVFWGDVHTHSSYSADFRNTLDVNDSMTPDHLFNYAIFRSLNFMVVTDHSENLTPEKWRKSQAFARNFESPGSFIPFLGYEFVNILPNKYVKATNVIFPSLAGGPVYAGNSLKRANSDTSISFLESEEELWTKLDLTASGAIGIIAGPKSDFNWDLTAIERKKIVGAEIMSTGGRTPKADPQCFQSSLTRGIMNGLSLGFYGSSNNHGGRPGEESLTGVLATDLSREAIFTALRLKRTYVTQGERLAISMDANGHFMGDDFSQSVAKETGVLGVRLTLNVGSPNIACSMLYFFRIQDGVKKIITSNSVHGHLAELTALDTLSAGHTAHYWAEVYLEGQKTSGPPQCWTSPITILALPLP
jgi:hypothetical protein